MPRTRFIVAWALTALLLGACGEKEGEATPAPDLQIERRAGYAVVVDESGGRTLIGFSADRNATSGDSYDVSQALWRVEAGNWNEPPVGCLAVGRRLELGISKVQNASQPNLLRDRVVWLSCLAPAGE